MRTEGYDVVIVGGGGAGCVLARRLAERGDRTVLLLEAGPDVRHATSAALRDGWGLPRGDNWPYDWGFESEPDAAGQKSPVRRGRILGGTSWLTRFAVRGHESDFDQWAGLGNEGWSFADVLPFFRLAESDAEYGSKKWHGSSGPIHVTRYPAIARAARHQALVEAMMEAGIPEVGDLNAPEAIGVGRMPMSTRDGNRLTTLDCYLPDDVELPNLRIRPDAAVARVELEGGRATGVRLQDGSVIRADLVILSAGVYGSPVILMRSGVGPADDLRQHGLGVVADLPGVGANLADHPEVELELAPDRPRPDEPVLHSIATFRSSTQPADGPPDLMFWTYDPASDGAISIEVVLLKPESRGTVRLRSADPADPPRISLPGVPVQRDADRLAEAYALGARIGGSAQLSPEGGVAANIYSLPHVVGTCRMGPSPGDGDVVNANGRVHGLDRLIVADASVIPEPTAGFPHIITIMLAEKIAAGL